MRKFKPMYFAASLLAVSPIMAYAGLAFAQRPAVYDAAQLPEVKGKIAQYTLNPRGDVDGFLLADGTEVHVPPMFSTQIIGLAKPGDSVTINGLKAKAIPMVAAAQIRNDATGVTLAVGPLRGGHEARTALEASGKIRALLHEPRGEVNGAVLEDGTIIRLPPPEASKLANLLKPGAPLVVKGEGVATSLGRVIAAREIGADASNLSKVAAPPREGMHGRMHGMMHGDGMHGDGMRPGGMQR